MCSLPEVLRVPITDLSQTSRLRAHRPPSSRSSHCGHAFAGRRLVALPQHHKRLASTVASRVSVFSVYYLSHFCSPRAHVHARIDDRRQTPLFLLVSCSSRYTLPMSRFLFRHLRSILFCFGRPARFNVHLWRLGRSPTSHPRHATVPGSRGSYCGMRAPAGRTCGMRRSTKRRMA
jgi:hypothetical protein